MSVITEIYPDTRLSNTHIVGFMGCQKLMLLTNLSYRPKTSGSSESEMRQRFTNCYFKNMD